MADSPEDAAADVLVGGGARGGWERVAGGSAASPLSVGLGSAGLWVPVFGASDLRLGALLGRLIRVDCKNFVTGITKMLADCRSKWQNIATGTFPR